MTTGGERSVNEGESLRERKVPVSEGVMTGGRLFVRSKSLLAEMLDDEEDTIWMFDDVL